MSQARCAIELKFGKKEEQKYTLLYDMVYEAGTPANEHGPLQKNVVIDLVWGTYSCSITHHQIHFKNEAQIAQFEQALRDKKFSEAIDILSHASQLNSEVMGCLNKAVMFESKQPSARPFGFWTAKQEVTVIDHNIKLVNSLTAKM